MRQKPVNDISRTAIIWAVLLFFIYKVFQFNLVYLIRHSKGTVCLVALKILGKDSQRC